MVSTQRIEELKVAFKKDAPWGARTLFLDSVNSVEELDELALLMKDDESLEHFNDETIQFYRELLTRWPDPKLEDWFKKDFPLVSSRLDTPQKIRVFLRAAHTRRENGYPGVSVSTLACVFEDIIRKHEVEGQKVIRYESYRNSSYGDALRIVYHTQLQYWTVTRLMLPEKHAAGAGTGGLFIDWRSKEEGGGWGKQ